jgi:hypothetical protein
VGHFLHEVSEFAHDGGIGRSSDFDSTTIRQLSDLPVDLAADLEQPSEVGQSEFTRKFVHILSRRRDGGTAFEPFAADSFGSLGDIRT